MYYICDIIIAIGTSNGTMTGINNIFHLLALTQSGATSMTF